MPMGKNIAIGLLLLLLGLTLGSKSDEVLAALGRLAETNETLVVGHVLPSDLIVGLQVERP